MKVKLSSARNLASGAVAVLLISLSACVAIRPLQTAQFGNGRDAQPGEKVRLEGLRFKAEGARLRSNSKPILDAAAESLKSEPDNFVYVDAYCDRHDSKRANQQLARQRAENVKAYLATQGIPFEHMIARGFGVKNPAAGNYSSKTYKYSSRVELIPVTNQAVTTNLAYSPPGSSSLN